MHRRATLLAVLVCLPLVACEAMRTLGDSLRRPRHQIATKTTTETPKPSDVRSTQSPIPAIAAVEPLELVTADAEHGWAFDQAVHGEHRTPEMAMKNQPTIMLDPCSPSTFAAIVMQGSRYGVSFRGKLYSGYDKVVVGQPGDSFAVSPDGERIGFLAVREGQSFFVVDGIEGPSVPSNRGELGQLIFSEDSVSYAYTVGKNTIYLDGKTVEAPPGGEVESVSHLGFGGNGHALHYVLQFRPEGQPERQFLVASGERRFVMDMDSDPRFFADGTPYWFTSSEPASDYRFSTLVVNGEEVGVGRVEPHSTQSERDPLEMVFTLVAPNPHEDGGRLTWRSTRIFVRALGRSWVQTVPERFADQFSPSEFSVSSAGNLVAYTVPVGGGRALVVGDRVSPAYERVDASGFTAAGRHVGLVHQGEKTFVLLDTVEQQESLDLHRIDSLMFDPISERVLIVNSLVSGSTRILSGVVGANELPFTDVTPAEWPTLMHVTFTDTGRVLALARRPVDRNKSLSAILEEFKVRHLTEDFYSEPYTGVPFHSAPDGSVVLWRKKLTGPYWAPAIMANERSLGRVDSIRDVVFGQEGEYAFVAVPAHERNPRNSAVPDPVLCVNGRFFDGLVPMRPGSWVDGSFQVLCTRGDGDSAEVGMATYRPTLHDR